MIKTSVASRNAMLSALANMADGGSIRIKAANGAVLAELQLGAPAFNDPEAGTLVANSITPDDSARSTGKATKYDVVRHDGSVIWSGDVSKRGGGGSLELDSTAIQSGAEVSISDLSYTLPE